jgi:hypothetical protein
MTDPRLLLSDTRLDEIERDAEHSRRLGLTVTFAVVSEQLAFVQELRRLRQELEAARAELRSGPRYAAPQPEPRPQGQPERYLRQDPHIRQRDRDTAPRERSVTPLEVEVTIVQRDSNGQELSRVRRRMPVDERSRD